MDGNVKPYEKTTKEHHWLMLLPRYGIYYDINMDAHRQGWQKLLIHWYIEQRCFYIRFGLMRYFVKAKRAIYS